ncbi:MAG: hypothetical protein L7H04_00255 [Vulcanisaeta sp.]|nr:hypothetical protein [Vulcanisaeta sp.]
MSTAGTTEVQEDVLRIIRTIPRVHAEMTLRQFVEDFLKEKRPKHIFDSAVMLMHELSYEKVMSMLGVSAEIASNIYNLGQIMPTVFACKNPPNCTSPVYILDGYTRSNTLETMYGILRVKEPETVNTLKVYMYFYDIDCDESERNAVICLTLALSTLVAKGLVHYVMDVYNKLQDVFSKYGITANTLFGVSTKDVKVAKTVIKAMEDIDLIAPALPTDLVSAAKARLSAVLDNQAALEKLSAIPPVAIEQAVLIIAARITCYGKKVLQNAKLGMRARIELLSKARKAIGDISDEEAVKSCISKMWRVGRQYGMDTEAIEQAVQHLNNMLKYKSLKASMPAELASAAMYIVMKERHIPNIENMCNEFGVTRITASNIAKRYAQLREIPLPFTEDEENKDNK